MLERTDTLVRDITSGDTRLGDTALNGAMPLDGTMSPSDQDMIGATLSCPQPDTTVCTVTGTVNLATAPSLADRLIEAVHDDRSHLVVDLSAASLLDMTGLLAVFDTLDRYEIDGHLAVVVNPYSGVVTGPETTALSELLDMHRDLGSALRACAHASISTAGRHRAKVAS